MDAFQRTLFPGGGDSVDDDACSVYTLGTSRPNFFPNRTPNGDHAASGLLEF